LTPRVVPLFRRKQREDEQDVSNVLYVRLAGDGGIFAVRGDTGAQAWIPRWLLEEDRPSAHVCRPSAAPVTVAAAADARVGGRQQGF
jgi:hypothetical protein